MLIREQDIGLFHLSLPWQATHPVGTLMRVIMLTFPRALVPVAGRSVRSLVGTTVPRRLPGRSLIAQTLIELTTTEAEERTELALPDVLQECTVGLIRRWLGQPAGISPRTRRLLHLVLELFEGRPVVVLLYDPRQSTPGSSRKPPPPAESGAAHFRLVKPRLTPGRPGQDHQHNWCSKCQEP